MKSTKPFRETLLELLELQGISRREMLRRGDRHSDETRTTGALHPILNHGVTPSVGLIEYVAKALMIEPETFAEYRMWQARRLFDPSDEEMGGFEVAIKNLQALERGAAEADLPVPPRRPGDQRSRRARDPKRAEHS